MWKGALAEQQEKFEKEDEEEEAKKAMGSEENEIKNSAKDLDAHHHGWSLFGHENNKKKKSLVKTIIKAKDKRFNVALLSNKFYTKEYFFHMPGNSWNDSIDGIIINFVWKNFFSLSLLSTIAGVVLYMMTWHPMLLKTWSKHGRKIIKTWRGKSVRGANVPKRREATARPTDELV